MTLAMSARHLARACATLLVAVLLVPASAFAAGPVLDFASYLGGSGDETAREGELAVASDGSIFVSGFTPSLDFPLVNPLQGTFGGGTTDLFVAKLSPDGGTILFSTFLGGNGEEQTGGLALDSSGNVVLSGYTTSTDFPVTAGAYQSASGGMTDAFVVKLSPDGQTLIASTYVGGTRDDRASHLALDSAGQVWINGTTSSLDFPLASPIQPALAGPADACYSKLSPDLSTLLFSTYWGGAGTEGSIGASVDRDDSAWFSGSTTSPNYPVLNPLQPALRGSSDATVVKLGASGTLLFSTFLGGSLPDNGMSIAAAPSGEAYVAGSTSSADFPTKDALQSVFGGMNDAFVAKLAADGSALLFSTYLGGPQGDVARSIALDPDGNACLVGRTQSPSFPLVDPVQAFYGGGLSDGWVAKMAADGQSLRWSTFLGGSAEDMARFVAADGIGNLWVNGYTLSPDFPVVNPFQPALRGAADMIVARISDVRPVRIDVRPGNDVSPVNPKSNGVTAVGILSEPGFDAVLDLDRASLSFGRKGTEASLDRCLPHGQDVNHDGLDDLVCHFRTDAAAFVAGDTAARLGARTLDGTRLAGSDAIRTVPE